MRRFGTYFLVVFALSISFRVFSKDELPYGGKKDIIVIHHPEKLKGEKEALLIMSGFGDSKKGRKNQKAYFDTTGYDLYIPDFLSKKSFEQSYQNFKQFYSYQKMGEYKKVHVLAYILGAWILNSFINEDGKQNISTIVYDRSPLQERAPKVVNEKIPLLGRMVAGQVLEDLTKIDYPTIDTTGLKIGVIIESKASPLIRKFKKKTMSYGPIDWSNPKLNQNYHDKMYTRLHHDEMYITFDEIGAEIMSFIRTGKFPVNARRDAFDWDPFKKYRKQ